MVHLISHPFFLLDEEAGRRLLTEWLLDASKPRSRYVADYTKHDRQKLL